MYAKLVMGTVLAFAAPQNQGERPQDRFEIHVPPIELTIPEIVIPAMDIDIQGFDYWVPEITFEMPEIAFDYWMPDVYFDWADLGAPGWSDWEDDSLWAQDMSTDTTLDVRRGVRLELRNHAGEIVIRTWDRSAVRVEARHSSRDRVKIFESESVLKIKSETRHGLPDIVDYTLTVPAAMPLDIWGFATDVRVDGATGGLKVETFEGTIELSNSQGELSVRSVEGDVNVRRSRGRLEANGVSGAIVVADFEGEVYAETIDGDIRVEGARSSAVDAKTVDGDVFFDGAIDDNGRYHLTTHDGDVVVALPERVNVTVSVATFDGEFETTFPIEISKAEASRRFSFVIGSGSASLELHSFDGDIRLMRR